MLSFRLVLVLGSALALGLGGCSAPGGGYTPKVAAVQDRVDCPASTGGWFHEDADSAAQAETVAAAAAQLRGTVPPGFTAVEAVLCRTSFEDEAGGDYTMVIREEHLEGDYSALLAALAVPSDRGGRGNCTADMEIIPPLWLVNAGGDAVNVTWPVDGCGKTRGKPDTYKALEELSVGQVIEHHRPGQ